MDTDGRWAANQSSVSGATAERQRLEYEGLSVCVIMCGGRQRKPGSSPTRSHLFVASLTNGSSFWRAVNCNGHQTPCTENRGAGSDPSIHCVTESCLSCWSRYKCCTCALLAHNVGRCLPVQSITSYRDTAGDSVISTLILLKSWTVMRAITLSSTSAMKHVYLVIITSHFLLV